jgi:hypothetical protein
MAKFSPVLLGLTFLMHGCQTNSSSQSDQGKNNDTIVEASKNKNLTGKWIRYSPKRNTIIEVTDTAHVIIYGLNSRNQSTDTLFSTMGFFNDTTIWIKIPTARFDYRVKGDTLIEFDKMGVQAKYTKVK